MPVSQTGRFSPDHPAFACGYGVTSRSRLQLCADILFSTGRRQFSKLCAASSTTNLNWGTRAESLLPELSSPF
jgi:hypothetical protein